MYQHTQRWLAAGVFEAMVDDLRELLRLAGERATDPSAVILDSRTLRSTPESGARTGFDGQKKGGNGSLGGAATAQLAPARQAAYSPPMIVDYRERIVLDPEVRFGKPTVRGTRASRWAMCLAISPAG